MSGSYPLPEVVCGYGSREVFDQSRKESGQWVFWDDRVECVLSGRYDDVRPLHVELSPTYLCNFACPWCSCRTAREDWSDEDVFNHPDATESTVMGNEKLRRVLDHLAAYRIGIQWVGGEPTMNPLLYPMTLVATQRGLKQCLFTNGSLLHPKRVDTLFDAELVFIRVSLDAVTKAVHRVHHGYREERDYAERVLANLRYLAARRIERGASTQVGVSVVVDERNLADVIPTARHLRSLCEELGEGAIDYAIFRPTVQFYNAQVELHPDTGGRLADFVRAGSEVHDILTDVGVRVVAPQQSFAPADQPVPPGAGRRCLSCGWFSEVTPNGDIVVCSDRYGNPEYFIGNLAQDSIDTIWAGEGRRRVLEFVERTRCFRLRCPRNGRGFHLNRIFHVIETFRTAGRLDDVRRWIDDLRRVLPPPEHSFFL